MNRLNRLPGLLLVLALLLLPAAALAEDSAAWPALTAEGFLEEGEFIFEGPAEGLWRYCSPTLRIEIVRKQETEPQPLIWYEAEIFTQGEEEWRIVTAEPGRHLSYGTWPYLVAQRNQVVFGINNDYAQGRYPSKNRNVGLVIREGKILWAKTRTKVSNAFPPLDILAFLPGGGFQVFDFNEHAAQEYLDMGIQNIQCFGPWLLRDGEINTKGLKRVGKSNNPRTAIGQIEKGHYIAVVVEGRHKQSRGVTLTRLAEIMKERDCTLAFNLDGGTTSCMMFTGVQINTVGGSKNPGGSARRITELVSIGVSEAVPKTDK